MKPIIQIALDFIELKRAMKLAHEAVKGGADWLEAGTPLIKNYRPISTFTISIILTINI